MARLGYACFVGNTDNLQTLQDNINATMEAHQNWEVSKISAQSFQMNSKNWVILHIWGHNLGGSLLRCKLFSFTTTPGDMEADINALLAEHPMSMFRSSVEVAFGDPQREAVVGVFYMPGEDE